MEAGARRPSPTRVCGRARAHRRRRPATGRPVGFVIDTSALVARDRARRTAGRGQHGGQSEARRKSTRQDRRASHDRADRRLWHFPVGTMGRPGSGGTRPRRPTGCRRARPRSRRRRPSTVCPCHARSGPAVARRPGRAPLRWPRWPSSRRAPSWPPRVSPASADRCVGRAAWAARAVCERRSPSQTSVLTVLSRVNTSLASRSTRPVHGHVMSSASRD